MGDFTSMFTSFAKNAANILVYVAIVALFIFGCMKCVAPVIRNRQILRRAIRTLKDGEGKRSWQEDNFLGKGSLMAHWSEYLANLFFADGEYHNPANVEDYINEETVIDDPGHADMAGAFPGLMVSLGFLGTLIGMSMGMSNMDLSSSAKVMEGIQTLIPGMKYAFMTSIVGVIGSIAFSLVTCWINSGAQRTLNSFYHALRTGAGVVSVDPMTQIAIYQQEQTAILQNLAADVQKTLPARINSVIKQNMEPMQASLDNFITATSREQVRGIERIVDRFVGHMDDALQGQFENLGETMHNACKWQQDLGATVRETLSGVSEVARSIGQVQQVSQSMIVKFDNYINKLGGAQIQLDDGYDKLASTVQHMDAASRQQAEYLKLVSQYQTDMQAMIAEFTKAAQQYTQAVQQVTEGSTAALDKISGNLQRNSEVLGQSHNAFVNSINKDLEHTFDVFDDNMIKVTDQLSRVVADIRAAVGDLPRVIDDANRRYADQLDQLIVTLQRAQVGLEDAAYRLYPDGGHARRRD